MLLETSQPGMTFSRVPTWDELAKQVATFLANLPDDPFATQTVLVPSLGHGRVLAQHFAASLPRAQAISAGVDFVSVATLYRRATAADKRWNVNNLAQLIAVTLVDGDHQVRPERVVSESLRMAALLRRYLTHCPNMLTSWAAGENIAADGKALPATQHWQPEIWRRIVQTLGSPPDANAAAATVPNLVSPVGVVLVGGIPAATQHLITALATTHAVSVWQYHPVMLDTTALTSPTAFEVALSRYLPADNHHLDDISPQSLHCHQPDADAVEMYSHNATTHLEPQTQQTLAQTNPTSLLTTLQTQLRNATNTDLPVKQPPENDKSVQIHLSHGAARQVEVLREVLCGVFADDPTLQPRDVVVLASDLNSYAPLIRSAFHPATEGHPGHNLRVALAANQLPRLNPVLELLLRVLQLPTMRCEAADLINIASHPQVAARFGFDEVALARLRELIAAAGIVWGLDAAHRKHFGLTDVRQSTWFAGVERLNMSALLKENSPEQASATKSQFEYVSYPSEATSLFSNSQNASDATNAALTSDIAATSNHAFTPQSTATATNYDSAPPPETPANILPILPVAGVEPQDLELIGALAELLSRLRRTVAINSEPATFDTWRERLLEQLEWLTSPVNYDDTTISDARAQLATLQGDSETLLVAAADLLGLLNRLASSKPNRPTYCNGSLIVTQLGDLSAVTHRVVVLLGVADDQWPRQTPTDPDDLTPDSVRVAERAEARWQLMSALLAAKSQFIVITKGLDPVTNQPLADPVALRDLRRLAVAGGGQEDHFIRRHPLQPHEWSDFVTEGASEPFSFNIDALHGAIAAGQRPTPATPQWPIMLPFPIGHPAATDEQQKETPNVKQNAPQVELEQLEAFFINPARELLAAHGLRFDRWKIAPPYELPLQLNALERYQIGQRLLDDTLAGMPPETALRRIRLAAMVAPGKLGSEQLAPIMSDVAHVVDQVIAYRGQTQRIAIHIPIAENKLTGTLTTYDAKLLTWRFGNIKAAGIVQLWLRLLALAVARPELPALGAAIGRGSSSVFLQAPDATQAEQLLAAASKVRAAGLTRLTPLPLETAAAWTGFFTGYHNSQLDARRAWLGDSFRDIPGEVTSPERSEWRYFFPNQTFDELLLPPPLPNDPYSTGSSRFECLANWFWQPISMARISATKFSTFSTEHLGGRSV
ncbi:MAG: exodeoxyribonuclease V subunit gamma [Propionibacteriaceae bacterium]|jgi:exodeoxyribonuclease V gamma subunit|nr:exodeoxyribonuclease V subunit gamma [Propionibacteriaceae bacterium]